MTIVSARKVGTVDVDERHMTKPAKLYDSDQKYVPNSSIFSFPIKIRFWIVRFFTCPIPFLSMNDPFIGGKSFIELFGLAFVLAISINFCLSGGAKNAGHIADYLGGIMIVFGMRNNILSILFGVSFERALYFHKAFGFICMATTLIHGIGCGVNDTGVIIGVLMGFTMLIYFARAFMFEMFYYLHIAIYLVIIPVSFIHGATFFPLAAIVWAVDLFARYCVTHKTISAQATVLPGDLVKIQFPHSFTYQPGQYCFLMVKSLSRVEYHPFSLSSSPLQDTTSFHVRALGDWTKKLHDQVAKQVQERSAAAPQHEQEVATTLTKNFVPLEICVEGPFGVPVTNFDDDNYTVSDL